MAEGSLTAHVSEFSVGRYKKAHRHGPARILILMGEGYSLFWREGMETQRIRVDWRPDVVVSPPVWWFHQHFNTGREPARYLAFHILSDKYPTFKRSVLAHEGRGNQC